MTRQVRLDEDVVALVESVSDGFSLTAATNRVLRRVLAQSVGDALPASETHHDSGEQLARSTSESEASERMATQGVSNGRVSVRRARTFARGCSHPLARRYGDRCAGCGAVIR